MHVGVAKELNFDASWDFAGENSAACVPGVEFEFEDSVENSEAEKSAGFGDGIAVEGRAGALDACAGIEDSVSDAGNTAVLGGCVAKSEGVEESEVSALGTSNTGGCEGATGVGN